MGYQPVREYRVTTPHPCPFPDSTIELIASYLPLARYPIVIDPFAGVGKIHVLPNTTYGIEIEPEWGRQFPDDAQGNYYTIIGDATKLTMEDATFSAAATSPCFGNRMADHHQARDPSARNTYRHKLGRELSPNSSAGMQWGFEYRAFHEAAWTELTRVVRVGGRFVLNIKNHIRAGQVQRVSEWHLRTLMSLGWRLHALDVMTRPGNRFGANRDQRVDHEFLMVFDLTHR